MRPSVRALENAILALSGAPLAAVPGATQRRGDDLYESYAACVAAEAAMLGGGAVAIHEPDCRPARALLFRRGPGVLRTSTQSFTHFCVTVGGWKCLEIHQGVKIRGRSGVEHEADVSLIHHAAADKSRITCESPHWRHVPLAIEAKFYSAPISLPVVRGAMGLASEFSYKRVALVAAEGATQAAVDMAAARPFAAVLPRFSVGTEGGLVSAVQAAIADHLAGNR